jgi:hypothetical protein
MTHPLPKEVAAFLSSLDNPKRVSDATTVLAMMQTITNLPPKMWGTSLIGFDSYHYKYDSGREGDSFVTGLSPRKQKLVIYITPGFDDYQHLLDKLGKHKTSVSCLYINKLEDIDLTVLEQLIAQAHKDMKAKYPDRSG